VNEKRKLVRKWFRILAAVTACLALVYPLLEAMDSTAITDSNTEFEVLAFLLVLGILVALIRLVLLAVQMLMWGSIQGEGLGVIVNRCWPLFLMVRPPGLDPVPSLRI
jgi:hypothetical protein